MAEEKRSKASAIDRESSRIRLNQIDPPAQRQLFLALLPAALSDAHVRSVLAAPLRTSRR